MIHIDFDSVHRLASVGTLVEPLRRAFRTLAVSPERSHYDIDGAGRPRTLLLMPAWQVDGDLGVKIVTVFPDNADQGLPSVNASYVLMSGKTGEPRAWINGRALTLVRTAAVSALAADLLAPTKPAVLLMVGTGALSRFLVEGHRAVRQYQSILIWGRDPNKASSVARELDARGWRVSAAADLEAAARSADVICCATLAEHALLEGHWLKAESHLDLVGSFKPTMREADDDCMRGARIVVDTVAALKESGDLSVPLARGIVAPGDIVLLGELIAASPAAPRAPRTVFKSVGVAHADLAVAQQLVERSEGSR
jgi:ornithine cyclodeaminase/alanine dehydrogenase-like protein (mu-crystallin family)